MQRASHLVDVPAKALAVQTFLAENRGRFLEEIERVKKIIAEKHQHDRRMLCIYKVYSRGSAQGEDALKHPRKVRLKFDRHNRKAGRTQASLYDVPDIVGLTIVVSYPSDINTVALVVDELVDQGLLLVPASMTTVVGTKADGRITSRYGRATESGGYFACHYNLQTPGIGARPVCEIQIKTVLHDAWGAKTHDLTYKPADRTDRDLLSSFELLGDVLANVDMQSDILRSSIGRRAAVREAKRSAIQIETIRASAANAVAHAEKEGLAHAADMRAIYGRIEAADLYVETELAQKLYRELTVLFDADHDKSCLLMCLLAVRSRRPEHGQNAQEAIRSWIEDAANDLDQIWARGVAALAAFGVGNASEAIDNAEEAVAVLERVDPAMLSPKEQNRLARLEAVMDLGGSDAQMGGDEPCPQAVSVRRFR
ncbi:hypothetical protein [uncultured Methylobacterium sp.]|uniref:hypothetical protein n=1 Tax=uncultured Methylobacterium sp. TaxID=157278 RepID=UPI002599BBB7|nr:hypothetical protein [uncultured Methylobacterium sp.]